MWDPTLCAGILSRSIFRACWTGTTGTDIYTYVHLSVMAHKTLTISEEAYNALARLKSKDESFTKVILRLAQKRNKGSLLEYIRSIAPDNELADRLEEVLEERQKIRLGARGR